MMAPSPGNKSLMADKANLKSLHSADVAHVIETALANGSSLREIADALTLLRVPKPRGGSSPWQATEVARIADRLGVSRPRAAWLSRATTQKRRPGTSDA